MIIFGFITLFAKWRLRSDSMRVRVCLCSRTHVANFCEFRRHKNHFKKCLNEEAASCFIVWTVTMHVDGNKMDDVLRCAMFATVLACGPTFGTGVCVFMCVQLLLMWVTTIYNNDMNIYDINVYETKRKRSFALRKSYNFSVKQNHCNQLGCLVFLPFLFGSNWIVHSLFTILSLLLQMSWVFPPFSNEPMKKQERTKRIKCFHLYAHKHLLLYFLLLLLYFVNHKKREK